MDVITTMASIINITIMDDIIITATKIIITRITIMVDIIITTTTIIIMYITTMVVITIITIMAHITYTLLMAFIIITSIKENIIKFVRRYLEILPQWCVINVTLTAISSEILEPTVRKYATAS